MSAAELLDRHFLEVRARLLEIAATLDRIDRAEGQPVSDPRLGQLQAGIELLRDEGGERAEKIQQLFSEPYDPQWRGTFGI